MTTTTLVPHTGQTMYSILMEAGAHKNRRRVGRGRSNGFGRTSGRGREGQRARGSISPSFMLKDILKVRKIALNTSINKILHRTFTITANMVDDILYEKMIAGANREEALQIFKTAYKINDVPQICDIFDVAFKYKRVRFAGFGKNNMTLNIHGKQEIYIKADEVSKRKAQRCVDKEKKICAMKK